jgi:tellurite resistance protein TerC
MVQSVGNPWLWAAFLTLVLALLALDLGVFNKRDHVVRTREAFAWMGLWASLASLFAAFVAWRFGGNAAADFVTGYLLEVSLSVDNLFVFVLVFGSFAVPARLQHRVLYWGILTALVLRGVMIVGGTALLSRFHWLVYAFGAFLLATGVRLLFHEDDEQHPERSWAFRVLRRFIPSTPRYEGNRFVVLEQGRRVATPLLLALVLIEISDVVFALDSVPAIFGVTLDPFIVFTSNIFAILGLRSLYFALARMMGRFHYLHYGLAAVLIFIGAKMGVSGFLRVPSLLALGVVLALLAGAIGLSLWRSRGAGARAEPPPPG